MMAIVFSTASSTLSQGPLSAPGDTELPFDIQFNFGPTIRQVPSALQTMEAAARIWESHIADPVTVFIDIDLVSLPGDGILGQASTETSFLDYSSLRDLLIHDAVTEFVVDGAGVPSVPNRTDVTEPIEDLDDRIVQYLPTEEQLQFNLPPGTTYRPLESGGSAPGNLNVPINSSATINGSLSVNRATLKALGALTPDDPTYLEPDGTIQLTNESVALSSGETTFLLDFSPNDGTTDPARFDGLAVAVHEIGHVLGFVSSLDFFGDTIAPTPMDLFRFPVGVDSFNPTMNPDPDAINPFEQFQTFTRELRPNVRAMTDFGNDYWLDAIDPAVEVAMAEPFGGDQTSHWREFPGVPDPGIMSPTLRPGLNTESLTAIDLRLFDLIGWDIVSPSLTNIDVSSLYDDAGTDPRSNPFDVDKSGFVSPMDALLVINDLSRLEGESDLNSTDSETTLSDVNDDGQLTPMDALLIINYMSRLEPSQLLAAVDQAVSELDEDELTLIRGPEVNLF